MNGVIFVSTRTGACLFARAFREDFGLPGAWGTHGEGASVSPTGRSHGAMQLAGLLFALDAHASELTAEDASGEGGGLDGSPPPGTLRRWSSGRCAVHFRKDHRLGVLCALFADAAADDAHAGALAETLLARFVEKHRERLDVGFGAPSKTLKFARELRDAITAEPVAAARRMARRANPSAPWVHVSLMHRERGGSDDGGVSGSNLEWWAEDTEGESRERDPRDARRMKKGAVVAKRAAVGSRSGVPFGAAASDVRPNADASSGGPGGWFCLGRAAVRRVHPVGAADVGVAQLATRTAAGAEDDEASKDACAAAAAAAAAADDDDVAAAVARAAGISVAALEGVVEATHAAAAVLAGGPGGGGGGVRWLELALAGKKELDAANASPSESPRRLLVLYWDGLAVAMPVDPDAPEGAAAMRAGVIRAEAEAEARNLRRAMRLLRHAREETTDERRPR